MRAVQFSAYGGHEVLEVVETGGEPQLRAGQVLVEVHAVSINPIDWKIRSGFLKSMAQLNLPVTIGGDFSGVVKKNGDNSAQFKVGDQVYGQAIVLNGGSGSFAELVAANTANIALKPKDGGFCRGGRAAAGRGQRPGRRWKIMPDSRPGRKSSFTAAPAE